MSTCQSAGFVTFFAQSLGASGSSFGNIFNLPGVSDFLDFLSDAIFYCSIRDFVINEIILGSYKENVSSRLASVIAYLSSVIFTIWVAYQGYLIIFAQNKQPILVILQKGGKIVFIMSLVSILSKGSPVIAENVFAFKDVISYTVVGYKDDDKTIGLRELIDINLAITSQLGKIRDSMNSSENGNDKKNDSNSPGMLGQGGPAILTAILMMLAELSVTFAIMLSPLFIFFLLFQQTSALFWSWTKFIIGALFSMAVLTVVATLALKATAIYGMSVLIVYYLTSIIPASDSGLAGAFSNILAGFDIAGSFNRLTTLGFLMAALIVGIPAMVMQFFNAGAAFASGAMNAMYGLGSMAGRPSGGSGGISGAGIRPGGVPRQSIPISPEVTSTEHAQGAGINNPQLAYASNNPSRSQQASGKMGKAYPANEIEDNGRFSTGVVSIAANDGSDSTAHLLNREQNSQSPIFANNTNPYHLGFSGHNNQSQVYSAATLGPDIGAADNFQVANNNSIPLVLNFNSKLNDPSSSRPEPPWINSSNKA